MFIIQGNAPAERGSLQPCLSEELRHLAHVAECIRQIADPADRAHLLRRAHPAQQIADIGLPARQIFILKHIPRSDMQPAFTDVMELQKFAGSKKMRAAKVPFEKLQGMLVQEAKVMIINPLGFSLPLTREQMKKIAESGL